MDISKEDSIGKILLKKNKISEKDIEKIMSYKTENELHFGEAVIKLGLVSKEDVEQALAYQFDNPYLSENENLFSREVVAAYKPFDSKVEALKELRTSLLLLGAGQDLKTICICDCNEGDGKTFTGVNLAVLFAQLGSKTLLMDFNLRTPKIHKLFNLNNSTGISTLLIKRTTLAEAIRTTPFSCLDILTSGPLPPNPLELIGRKSTPQLIETIKTQYEIIILNTPSFSIGPDSYHLSALADGVLIVALKERTRKDELIKIKRHYKENRVRLLGVVLNQHKKIYENQS